MGNVKTFEEIAKVKTVYITNDTENTVEVDAIELTDLTIVTSEDDIGDGTWLMKLVKMDEDIKNGDTNLSTSIFPENSKSPKSQLAVADKYFTEYIKRKHKETTKRTKKLVVTYSDIITYRLVNYCMLNKEWLDKLSVYFIDSAKRIHKIGISMTLGLCDCPDGFLDASNDEVERGIEIGLRNIIAFHEANGTEGEAVKAKTEQMRQNKK